ncbi:hypothetical protein ES695_20260 [Candidatus Atribacteria bacterium 1244-E10-H5-B2]|nr:MAG: hypothetical protein ES695_20260 [Candidatus Atribacteria bacterium 1244-E10-H5-B2]
MNKYDSLTKNFKFYEVWSGDRKLGKNSIEPPEEYREYLFACVEQLQNVRDLIEKKFGEHKIIITSAYRTPEWNRTCGGVSTSLHLRGLAIDSRAVGIHLFLYYSYLLKYTKFNQYGYYRWKNFVHSGLMNNFTIFKY